MNKPLYTDTTLQTGAASGDGPVLMSDRHKQIIQDNFALIAKNLTAGNDFLNELTSEGIITLEELETFIGMPKVDRPTMLLLTLCKREDRTFSVFIEPAATKIVARRKSVAVSRKGVMRIVMMSSPISNWIVLRLGRLRTVASCLGQVAGTANLSYGCRDSVCLPVALELVSIQIDSQPAFAHGHDDVLPNAGLEYVGILFLLRADDDA